MVELLVVDDIATEAAKRFILAAPHTVALAGGQTPRPVYQLLASLDYPWSATEIFFGDERCVPRTSPDSNFRMAQETLLSRVPAVVHAMPGETCDARSYEDTLARTFGPGTHRFDLVFLGLGSEGHTASLFPGSSALEERDRNVVAVHRPDHSRLTLTLPVLSAAKLALFLVSGTEKHDALQRLLRGDDIPAARVHAERVLIISDRAAAFNGSKAPANPNSLLGNTARNRNFRDP
jgi:6-phosphogluconolactonase